MAVNLSIIIPVYNSEKYIECCIESLLDQDIPKNTYEIIIVDDGSKDSSGEIADNYCRKNSCVHVVHQKNKGVGAARNTGMNLAKGKYIYFIDPDDYLARNVLGTLLKYATVYNLDVLGFKAINTTNRYLSDSSTNNLQENELSVMDGVAYIAENQYRNQVWWYFIKRSFLLESKIRFIEGRWMEDVIFTATLLLRTKRVSFLDFDIHRYVIVENSAMTSKDPVHCTNLIYDLANAAREYAKLINSLSTSHASHEKCLKRLRTKQQSLVFALLIRAIKSKLTFSELKELLLQMKKIGAYPLNSLIGEDYHSLMFRVLTVVFNHGILLYPGFKTYRFAKKVLQILPRT
ncbi:glycosyltransferase [Ulvibacterium sp.]|uniref:glycosyltransferase n=1 Tax=Ulvibacterium sp. TaxID=2665914 RepID=UPI003BAC3031